jgi:signal transduction histidine kinase
MRESRDNETVISQGLDVLQRNTETLTELISDLLDISRITTGTLTLDFEEVDLKQIVSSSVETLRVQAAGKGIALKSFVEIPEEIGCRVWGDEVRLQQILANVLSNAIKFTPNGDAVTVHLRKARAAAILVVKDTGTGIPPEFLPHAFEQFAQAKSSSRENRGMGLGLAISKHLVELHRGSISIESEGLGRGTTLKVELPLMASTSPLSLEPPREDAFTEEEGSLIPDLRA